MDNSDHHPVAPNRRIVLASIGTFVTLAPTLAAAESAAELDQKASAALAQLYSESERARGLGARAKGILIFPKIVKAGFMVGGQTGNGSLRINGKPVGYYNISAGSFGLQAGAQAYAFVLFFESEKGLDYLRKSDGWAVGSGPSVVVVDKGMAKTANTTTLTQDVYAMAFGQKGLMGGLGLEGSKITPIKLS